MGDLRTDGLELARHHGGIVARAAERGRGRNFDILVGLTAIPIAIAAWGGTQSRPRLALGLHVVGLALLVNIVALAVLAAPGPQHLFTVSPPNTIVGDFPYVWLPTFLVPIAALGHVVGIRQAMAQRSRSMSPSALRVARA